MLDNLSFKINELKKEKNFVILAHNYQIGEIQDIADYVGDSFYLSKKITEIDVDTVYFCGVRFMAETAKILSPQKSIVLVRPDATCPMADMVDEDELKTFKENNQDYKIVSYVNTSVTTKALSDICVTSSVAIKIMDTIEDENILFLPDRNLGRYIKEKSGRKNMSLYNGFCPIHERAEVEDAVVLKSKYPNAKFLVHPECKEDVLRLADFIGSTSEIINYVKTSESKEFIIGTEIGVIHSIEKENPEKSFYPLYDGFVCPNMKKTTLYDLYESILGNSGENIEIDENLRLSALSSLEEMVNRGV